MKKMLKTAFIALAMVCATHSTGFGQTGNSASTPRPYAVGDYYPDPQNPATATGLIFKAEKGRNSQAWMVSLDEGKGTWGDPERIDLFCSIFATDSSTDDLIQSIKKDYGSTELERKYQIFHWVHTVKNQKIDSGPWYLPSQYDLQDLYEAWNGSQSGVANKTARATFNQKLIRAGGTGISYGYYWSCTERSDMHGACVDFQDGISYKKTPKTQVLPVRAIRCVFQPQSEEEKRKYKELDELMEALGEY